MNSSTPSTRRDTRFLLRIGTSSVRFVDPAGQGRLTTGTLSSVSAAGLAFQVVGNLGHFPSGSPIETISLRIGSFMIEGEAVVRNLRPLDEGRVEVGCLFYPTASEEERWFTFLAGIDVGVIAVQRRVE